MSKYVLDASAVLTILNQEPGKERVEAILGQAAISTVNVAETIGTLMDAGMSDANARASLQLLHLEVIDFDIETARLAGSLKPATHQLGLSLGDRCCLALGSLRGNTVVTADRLWAKLKCGIQVEILR